MTEKIKVIFCTDGIFPYSIGGMQRHSRLLIETISKNNNIEIIVLHPHDKKVFSADLSLTEIQVTPINTSKNYLLECYRYSKRIYDIVIKYPDHLIYSQGLCIWYNIKYLRKRTIINPHGLEPYQAVSIKDKLIALPFIFVFNYLFKYATVIISLGGKFTDILKNKIKDPGKIVVIPNAILSQGENIDKKFRSDKTNLLFIARFAHNKGIHILMKAIQNLNRKGYKNKLEFYLGGSGPLFNFYSNSFKIENVHYLGFIPDRELFELYKTKDIFVLPTLFEGMPTVVLEAMSYGLPVIVSDVGATGEIVDHENGYLIQKNSVQQLMDSIVQFHESNNSEKKRMSLKSIEKVESKFTWKMVSFQHALLFEKMMVNIHYQK
ncbi:MAG TPA: glycosyltransferase family 4 protein [Bacteroidia bacterium]|nr:glycosyltransferase family 4 protein [Bacteroidia bacterium]